MENDNIMLRTVERLSASADADMRFMPCGEGEFPSHDAMMSVMETIRSIFFPDFFDRQRTSFDLRRYFIGVNVERLYALLAKEIALALRFKDVCCREDAERQSSDITTRFIGCLPLLKDLIYKDVEAVFNNDPSVNDYGEVVLSYPAVKALMHYRIAHQLLELGVPVLPRMLTEAAHSLTGIDINPGAVIGEYFAIDHGTGVVIGETCIIGKHCTLYQGVTLGAKNFVVDSEGRPVNVPRHPILEDNVTVYSNATVLGRIVIGHDTVIGGNIWVTNSVPPFSRVLQRRPVESTFIDGAGI